MEDGYSGEDLSAFGVGGEREDELFDVLSHPRRRFTLRHLQTAEAPLSVDELTTKLGAWAAQRSTPGNSESDRDAIGISLVHVHLPKLAAAGLVNYDAAERTVASTDQTGEVREHLKILPSD